MTEKRYMSSHQRIAERAATPKRVLVDDTLDCSCISLNSLLFAFDDALFANIGNRKLKARLEQELQYYDKSVLEKLKTVIQSLNPSKCK